MMQLGSRLIVADNTGAKEAAIIGIPGKGNRKYAYLGDLIVVSIKKASPYSQVKKGQMLTAVIIRTRKEKGRKDGSYVRFDDNACVILQDKNSKEPKGTRVFGPVAREVKQKDYSKIASLAAEIY